MVAASSQAIEEQANSGAIPLTPIQQRYFEQGLENIHYYNQAVLLRLGREVRLETLEQVAERVLEQVELELRSRLDREAGLRRALDLPLEDLTRR